MNYTDIDDVLQNVRQIIRGCPPVTLRRAFMRAAREWCQQTQWLRMTVAGATTANTQIYTLGSDADLDISALRAISVTDSAGGASGLAPTDSTTWNPNLSNGLPRRYCYVPEGQFALNPTPDKVYALSIGLIVIPKETTRNVPSSILVKYSNDIEAGALAYLLTIPGQPWTDLPRGEREARAFQAGIANGKTDAQRAYNTGSMRARSRPFLVGSR